MLSLTCDTVPEEEEISVQRMVWIESMTTRPGLVASINPQISSTSLSATREMFSCGTPRRSARSLICRTDSSPVTYSTSRLLLTSPHSCKRIVDLPMPGSPPISVTLPSTMPPPSTRSSSPIPVTMRLFSSVVLIVLSLSGVRLVCPGTRAGAAALPPDGLAGSATTSSTIVFHAPHDGQRPSQRGLVSPHWVQT